MDLLQFAIDMELDGEHYYREQAARNGGNPLRVVFEALAADEARHAQVLTGKRDGQPYTLEPRTQGEPHSPFTGAADYAASVREQPDQPELYHTAISMEDKSIALYADLSAQAGDAQTKALFDYLIGEETAHKALLDEIYHHVNRPHEWVESAEFGKREDY